VAWVVDLDGVLWRGAETIGGSPEAVRRLQAATEVVFVTNNSYHPIAHYEARLGALGVDAHGAVLSSAQAAASLVSPGERALVCGGPGLLEAVAARGAEVVEEGNADVVLVGYRPDFDYEMLRRTADVVRAGARFVATNTDATYPVPGGLLPGTGALVAAMSVASGVTPEVAGKPHGAVADLILDRLGPHVGAGVVAGDRVETDGALARRLGYRFALVLSGVSSDGGEPARGATDPVAPDLVAPDLAAAVAAASGDPERWGATDTGATR
jgi:HAD superfamily hydrolase (TIGR01450 family)